MGKLQLLLATCLAFAFLNVVTGSDFADAEIEEDELQDALRKTEMLDFIQNEIEQADTQAHWDTVAAQADRPLSEEEEKLMEQLKEQLVKSESFSISSQSDLNQCMFTECHFI